MHPAVLSETEKQTLFADGFVILRDVVPRDITERAKALISEDPSRIVHGNQSIINDLYNESVLPSILDEAMGPHTRPRNAQVAVVMPKKQDAVTGSEFRREHPIEAHVDGGWAGVCPIPASEIEANGDTLHSWGYDQDPKWLGPAGAAPLWQDEARTLAIGSYTALVGVCLNDQTEPGKGQFSVQRGAHEAVEAFFRMQRAAGGPIGGGGPQWPRLVRAGKDSAVAGLMPDALKASYPDNPFNDEAWPWPQLTPTLMQEGDAVLALHSLPHSATPNLSDDPRMNVFFRIRRARPENPHEDNRKVGWGLSDHPDRALNGDFLEYPDDYDPYATSVTKLCNHWSEWDGMRHITGVTTGAEDNGAL